MTKDLTEGRPFYLILGFSIPVLCGYLFQQFYSVTDTVIVSRCLGVEALAAVGSTGSVNFLIIGFVMGLCGGFAIPAAQRFGAKDYSMMRCYVANSVYLCIAAAAVMTAFTVVFCRPLLTAMQTPLDIIDEADAYIRIIFQGIPIIFLYNMTSSIIRALGDSKTPVYFLVLSSLLNIALDIVFITVFGLGVRGAAFATVISQAIAGLSCLAYMGRKFTLIRAGRKERRFNSHFCAVLCGMGIPMGLQYSITAVGSVILAASVNMLGSGAVASCTAGGKVSMFFCSVFDSLGTTMATYGGQNTGARKFGRLNNGVRDSMIIASIYSVLALALFILFGRHLVMLFIDSANDAIIRNARLFLIENGSAYIFLAGVNVFRFMIQGMGFSRLAIFSGAAEMIARTIMGVFMVPRLGFVSAGLASPFAWILADLFLVPAFIHCRRELERE